LGKGLDETVEDHVLEEEGDEVGDGLDEKDRRDR
jgi:hypothetical protein